MIGDKLASGARSATFTVAPGFKYDEAQMRKDLRDLPKQKFQEKYLIADAEYDLLNSGSDEHINSFAEQMKRQAEFYERGLQTDKQQADSLRRECFLTPFVAVGLIGRVIVDRDEPATPKGQKGRLLIPRSLRKEKTLLPTTGHIIKAVVINDRGEDISQDFLGKRILFGQMSGTPICFKMYPTWIQLELAEILAWVNKEDVEVLEVELEPMV
jgi:hypothetical protein